MEATQYCLLQDKYDNLFIGKYKWFNNLFNFFGWQFTKNNINDYSFVSRDTSHFHFQGISYDYFDNVSKVIFNTCDEIAGLINCDDKKERHHELGSSFCIMQRGLTTLAKVAYVSQDGYETYDSITIRTKGVYPSMRFQKSDVWVRFIEEECGSFYIEEQMYNQISSKIQDAYQTIKRLLEEIVQ